jgi:hypothetical protein
MIGSYLKTPRGTKHGYGFRLHTQNPNNNVHLFSDITEVYYFENPLHVTGGIIYVHQLQNLYFALTGQELTLKQN